MGSPREMHQHLGMGGLEGSWAGLPGLLRALTNPRAEEQQQAGAVVLFIYFFFPEP